jgi:hypothetical protein
MNDDFLHQFREPPRPEFARSLYQRISHDEAQHKRDAVRWAAMGLAGASLAFVIALAAAFASSAVTARLSRGQIANRSQEVTLIFDQPITDVSWVASPANSPQLLMPAHDQVEPAVFGGPLKVREIPLSHHGSVQ